MKNIQNLDQQHIKKLENVKFQPVFILGLHRSGTSILYKMITATQCFNPVTTYHIIKYDQLIHNYINKKEDDVKHKLTNSFREQGQIDRGIDKMEITADFAEEYGFLLRQKTFQMYITPKNLSLFTEMVKKIQFISNNNKPILLKNPYDFPNFLYIKRVFPDAKFIFIHRTPLNTLSSMTKALKVLLRKKNLYTSQLFKLYDKLFENSLLLLIVRQLFAMFSPLIIILLTINSLVSMRYYSKNIQKLPKDDYLLITYEDLCMNPQKNMKSILDTLNIKPNNKIDFKLFIKPRKTQLDTGVKQLEHFISKYVKIKRC